MRLLLPVLGLLLFACSGSTTSQPTPTTPATPPVTAVVEAVQIAPTPSPPKSPLAGQRICIDPGHDAKWAPGATGRNRAGAVPLHPADGVPLHEHELTVSVGLRLQAMLEGAGAAVCLTRKTRAEGGGVLDEPYDYNGDGRVSTGGVEDTPERTQPRIDAANNFGAAVLLSIHFNGSSDARVRGSEAYYTAAGPTAEQGKVLAATVLDALVAEMASAGHQATNHGIKSDAYQRYTELETARLFGANAAIIRRNGFDPTRCPECYRLFTLGNNPMSLHRASYLGVLVEVEFLSNPDVVESFLMRPDSLDVIAQGLFHGLEAYFDAEGGAR